ncbi:MAG: HK97 gp10 family phage protein [Alteromonadaceae bacterium]|nr:HK97 gp10 family phage protein [Alteromonadaceae bacterium]
MLESMNVSGLKGLETALKALEVKTAQKVMVSALRAAAKPVYEDVLANAPKDTGALLFNGIKIRSKKGKGQTSTVATARVAINKKYFHRVLAAEYGTAKQPAHPFLRQALTRNWQNSVGIFSSILKKRIESVARKQARVAKKVAKR